VVWLSKRIAGGKVLTTPDLVVEVLSTGADNTRRDRVQKLALYSQKGVREYWIVDWRVRRVDVFRRDRGALLAVATLDQNDELRSSLLTGFHAQVVALFRNVLDDEPD
jgi:Uma2 family endonuclease